MENEVPNEINYLKDGHIKSNSQFYYKDITSFNYTHRIKLDPSGDIKCDSRNQIPLFCLTQSPLKHFSTEEDAFKRANTESAITQEIEKHKYQKLLQKDKKLKQIFTKKNKEIKDNFKKEKEELRKELTTIIRDSLQYMKKNNPLNLLMQETIFKAKEDKNLSVSLGSVNLTQLSTLTHKKYESNEFLRNLGLDLDNLSPDNINIDIDKAYEFVHLWKTDRDLKEVIRLKVVNQIMSIEQKKSIKKVAKVKEKMNEYKEKKKSQMIRMRKELEEALRKEQESIDPRERMKQRMRKSVRGELKFDKNKKEKNDYKRANTDKGFRTKRKVKIEIKIDEQKPKLKLNSYQHIDKVLKFIHDSENLSENPNVCKHFLNIKSNKNMDDLVKKIILRNKFCSIVETSDTITTK